MWIVEVNIGIRIKGKDKNSEKMPKVKVFEQSTAWSAIIVDVASVINKILRPNKLLLLL